MIILFVFFLFCFSVNAQTIDVSTGAMASAAISVGKIDNFDNDSSYDNSSKQTDAQWWDGYGAPPSTYNYLVVSTLTYNSSSASLEVNYIKYSGAYTYFTANDLNKKYNISDFSISKSSSFSCQIFSTITIRILTRLKDADGDETDDLGINKTTSIVAWNKLEWSWEGKLLLCDTTGIKEILFFVEPGSTSISGKFYLDDLYLENSE